MSYINKSADELLLDRVNEVNGDVFTLSDLSFGDPIVTDEHGKNTKFLITPGPRFTPEPEVEYYIWVDRLDATELFRRYGIDRLEVPHVQNTTEVADWLSQTYGLPIVHSDVELQDVVEDDFVLQFTSTSKVITGQLLCRRGEAPLFLSDLLTVTVLEGFDYPDAVVDHLIPPVVVENGDLGSHGTTNEGNLLVGTGVPAKGMTISTNNELELALSASRAFMSESPRYIEPVDGVYTIEVTNSQEWNFLFSVASFGIEVPVTDLYDILLYIRSKDTGEHLEFSLRKGVQGGYHWVNDDYELDISDSAVSGAVIQNIQRLSFYQEHFEETPRTGGTPNALLGDFEIGLVGYRKNSLVPRVASIIRVNAVLNALQ